MLVLNLEIHNSDCNFLFQGQVEQLEKRNDELESKFSVLTKANLDLQQTERELRDQLVTSIPKEDYEMLSTKVSVIALINLSNSNDEQSSYGNLSNCQSRLLTIVKPL